MSVATGGTYLPGNWTVYYDWNCNGGPGSALWTFNADHTFTTSEGLSGTWSQTDNQIILDVHEQHPVQRLYRRQKHGRDDYRVRWDSRLLGSRAGHDRFGDPARRRADRFRRAGGGPRRRDRHPVPGAEAVERVTPGEGLEPPASIEDGPEVDLTTGRPPTRAPHRDLSPLLEVTAGGLVLWDLTHGVYDDYEPAGRYSSLTSLLTSAGYTVDTTTAGVNNVSLWSYDILVVNLASAWYSAYTPAEVHAIELYVWNGGTLLVVAENPAAPTGTSPRLPAPLAPPAGSRTWPRPSTALSGTPPPPA